MTDAAAPTWCADPFPLRRRVLYCQEAAGHRGLHHYDDGAGTVAVWSDAVHAFTHRADRHE